MIIAFKLLRNRHISLYACNIKVHVPFEAVIPIHKLNTFMNLIVFRLETCLKHFVQTNLCRPNSNATKRSLSKGPI